MTDKDWGGAREGAGRPCSGSEFVRTSVGLTEEQRAYCRELGGGVVARGVRRAVDGFPFLLRALEFGAKYGDGPITLEELARQLEEGIHPGVTKGWAIWLRQKAAQARAAVAGARGKDVQE